jgi:RNA polymerase sigma-70 factor (ECF subfamily)
MISPYTITMVPRDKPGFEKLFRLLYSPLCAYANSFLKDVDASEEVVQEILFRLWESREKIEIRTTVQSYLYRAVRNASLNVLKHEGVKEAYRTMRKLDLSVEEPAQEDPVVIHELHEKIRQSIDRLPGERKKIFILSRYKGMTYAEIAGKLGISVKTVENQMGSALKTLRVELSDYLPLLALLFFDWFN